MPYTVIKRGVIRARESREKTQENMTMTAVMPKNAISNPKRDERSAITAYAAG